MRPKLSVPSTCPAQESHARRPQDRPPNPAQDRRLGGRSRCRTRRARDRCERRPLERGSRRGDCGRGRRRSCRRRHGGRHFKGRRRPREDPGRGRQHASCRRLQCGRPRGPEAARHRGLARAARPPDARDGPLVCGSEARRDRRHGCAPCARLAQGARRAVRARRLSGLRLPLAPHAQSVRTRGLGLHPSAPLQVPRAWRLDQNGHEGAARHPQRARGPRPRRRGRAHERTAPLHPRQARRRGGHGRLRRERRTRRALRPEARAPSLDEPARHHGRPDRAARGHRRGRRRHGLLPASPRQRGGRPLHRRRLPRRAHDLRQPRGRTLHR